MASRATAIAAVLCVWTATGSVASEQDEPAANVAAATPSASAAAASDPALGAISGIVTDAVTGQPLAGMRVWSAFAESMERSTLTDAGGAYVFSDLLPGTSRYRIWVVDDLWAYQSQIFDHQDCYGWSGCNWPDYGNVTVFAGQTTTGIDLPLLKRGKITGRVFDSRTGAPISGVSISCKHPTYGDERFVSTSSDGVYTCAGLDACDVQLFTRSAPGYHREMYDNRPYPCYPCSPTLVHLAAGTVTSGIDFALDTGGRVSGRVVEASTMVPLEGIRAELIDTSGSVVASSLSDSNGSYVIVGSTAIAPGSYYVRTSGSARHSDELYDNVPCSPSCSTNGGTLVSLVDGETRSGIDFALTLNGDIKGRVVDAVTGAPLQYAWIEVRSLNGGQVGSASTDADGYYAIGRNWADGWHGLPTGSYFAKATMGNYAGQLYSRIPCEPDCTWSNGTPIQVVAGQVTEGVNFALTEKGRIEGRVTIAGTGAPVQWVTVTAEKGTSSSDRGYATTDADGRYSIRGLQDGSYRVVAEGSRVLREVYDNISCPTLPCDEVVGTPVPASLGKVTANVDFALVEKGRIEGAVIDASTGVPIADAWVLLYDSAGQRIGYYTRTASDGTYWLSAAPAAGTYFARAWALTHRDEMYDGHACNPTCEVTSATPLSLAPGSTTTGVNFALGPLDSRFHSVAPCRVLDTRSTGPSLGNATSERWVAVAGVCGIPTSARAVAVHVTVTGATGSGHLIAYTDRLPTVSTVNFRAGQTRGNSAVVALDALGYIKLWAVLVSDVVYPFPEAHVVLDVNGYFQ